MGNYHLLLTSYGTKFHRIGLLLLLAYYNYPTIYNILQLWDLPMSSLCDFSLRHPGKRSGAELLTLDRGGRVWTFQRTKKVMLQRVQPRNIWLYIDLELCIYIYICV